MLIEDERSIATAALAASRQRGSVRMDLAALARGARLLEAKYRTQSELVEAPEAMRRFRNLADDYAVFAAELEEAAAAQR
jgi:hypothetical protein